MGNGMKNFMIETGRELKGLKKYLPVFAGSMLFSVALYYLLMAHQLVNSNDGIWEYSYYKAGRWSLTLGRWLLLYLDRLHFGISTDPLTSLITLTLYSLGLIFLLDVFCMGRRKAGYLAAMLFTGSVAICSSLTYRFTSPSYGLAFLLGMLAVWILVKGKGRALPIVSGGMLLACSMGLYQAYLGCVCMALLGYFLFSLYKESVSLRNVLTDMARAAGMGMLGGILYVAALRLHLAVFHLELSGYMGAERYSLSNTVKYLPDSIARAYREFFRYFGEEGFILDMFRGTPLLYAVLGLFGLFFVYGLVRLFREDRWKAALGLFLLSMIPVACNMVLLIVTAAEVSVLMTVSMASCMPVLLCVMAQTGFRGVFCAWLRRLTVLLLGVALYGSIYQIQIDQQALLEGQRATITMAEGILHRLDQEGCLDSELEYCVVGVPAYNSLFAVSRLYEASNMYAHFGGWYNEPSCTRRSWQGVFSYLCGANLTMCSSGDYGALYGNDTVRDMPSYPEEGFIRRIGDIVVVKVAEY